MYNKACCKIQTPEGVVFRLYPAGLVRRMSAFLIDSMMLVAILSAANSLIPLFFLFMPKVAYAIIILADFIIGIIYWIVLEWLWNGKTVGKKLLKLRVVDSNGLKLLPQQVITRNLLRSVDFLPIFYAAASVSCFLDPRVRRLGDIAAGTIVIHDIEPSSPDLSSVLPDKYNSLRDYPLEAARLRDKISPEESALLLDALRRRNQLNPKERYHVYADLAAYFKQKIKLPESILDGMSDEKFLRNLIDIVYQH
jgi:uncharacterized RDD family membrane protein YckC